MNQAILFTILSIGLLGAGVLAAGTPTARKAAVVAAFAAVLMAFGPSLWAHLRAASDPLTYTEDAAQHIAPYYTLSRHVAAGKDLSGAYYRACHPLGYRLMMSGVAHVMDPRRFAEVAGYVLLLAFCAALAAAVWPLSGPVGAAVSCAFALSANMFMEEISGGLPRSYGFPLMALACCAAVRGAPLLLAATVIVSAASYPVVGITAGLGLAAWLLIAPGPELAAKYTFRWRLTVVLCTGAISVLILAPGVTALRPYGPALGAADTVDYPETTTSGRLAERDQPGFRQSPVAAIRLAMGDVLQNQGRHWVEPLWRALRKRQDARAMLYDALLLVSLLTALLEARHHAAVRRLLLLGAAALVAYGLSVLASPRLFMPQRHLAYTWPVLLLVLVAAAPGAWERALTSRGKGVQYRWLAGAAPALLGLFLLACEGGAMGIETGLETRPASEGELAEAVSHLPADSLIAGWPKSMDSIPYLAGRPVLMNYETWIPYHRYYTDTMRARFLLLLPSLLSAREEDLRRMQDEFGVSHLVVDLSYTNAPPRLFRAFRSPLRAAWKARRDWLADAPPSSVVYRGERFVLVSLRDLDPR